MADTDRDRADEDAECGRAALAHTGPAPAAAAMASAHSAMLLQARACGAGPIESFRRRAADLFAGSCQAGFSECRRQKSPIVELCNPPGARGSMQATFLLRRCVSSQRTPERAR